MVGSAKVSVTFLALSLANVTFYIQVLSTLATDHTVEKSSMHFRVNLGTMESREFMGLLGTR